MRTNPFRCLMGLAALILMGPVHADDHRMLFANPDYEVTLNPDYYCGDGVTVTVKSDNPKLFEAGSSELQRIVDATHAALAYECPTISVLDVMGRLTGLPAPIYLGVSERRSNWELETIRSIRSEEYGAGKEQIEAYQGDQARSGGREFTVSNLAIGMSVDDVREIVLDTFGVESAYDVQQGMLSMQAQGCPALAC